MDCAVCQGLPEHPNTGLCLAFRRLVLEAEAADLLSGSECRVLLFNDMVRHHPAAWLQHPQNHLSAT